MKSDFVFALENASWPSLLVNDTGVIQRANAAARTVFGDLTDGQTALAASIWAQENPLTPPVFLSRSQRTSSPSSQLKFRIKEGSAETFHVFLCPVPLGGQQGFLLQLFRASGAPSGLSLPAPSGDVFEASLAQKQKLDCALQLTRTVALDFNNALTSILGHTSLILAKIEPNHPWRTSLVEVEKSAEKAAEIAHDLAAFSRQEKDSQAQIAGNLNDLVRRTVSLFQSPANRQITWNLQLESRSYTTQFEEAKMQQAFVKILDNALQAIQGAGEITVRTRNHDVTESKQDGMLRLEAGHYVCIEFADTGCGISAELLPRIFEPFFTTKKDRNHRGLGLAWVYGIVTNHGGSVSVTSQPGQGALVRVFLPASKKVMRDRSLQSDDLTGTQTILMIDDEDLLLTLGETVLSSYGYRVLTANSGPQGLEIFSKAPQEIDLVITDLVMPKMSGREVIEHLRKLVPDVKIICSSGYVRALNAEEEEIYLQKPFTSQDLLRKVKQAFQIDD
jgi:signal transduction histidine kinase